MKLLQTSIYLIVSYLTLNSLHPTILAQSYSKPQISSQFQPSVDTQRNPQTIGAATRFKPPVDDQANPETVGAATRGNSCLEKQVITSLLPTNKSGRTLKEQPTFFWYIPKSTAATAEFILLTNNNDGEQELLYEKNFNLPEKSGIVSFTLPEQAISLETNNSYRWYLTIICDSNDAGKNPYVEGIVKRVAEELPELNSTKQVNLLQQASNYAQAGIWHDALTSLAKLRCQKPNDPVVKVHWTQFLDSVGLNKIASESLVNSCLPKNESSTK